MLLDSFKSDFYFANVNEAYTHLYTILYATIAKPAIFMSG